jgi:hypothetical protein
MQNTELTLSSATLLWREKNNTIAMQLSERRGTQDTVNSNSGDGSTTYRHAKESKRICEVTNDTGRTKYGPCIITTLAIPRY